MWMQIARIIICFHLQFSMTSSMVSPYFGMCNEFFDHNFFPTGYSKSSNIAEICQNDNGKSHDIMYATLFDEFNKIPIYSAYILDRGNSKCPLLQRWYAEQNIPKLHQPLGIHGEYKRDGYIRGQLGLNCYPTEEGKESVYALTNTIPEVMNTQDGGFNKVQEKSKHLMDEDCIDGVPYYISGAIPGGKKTDGNVNIPGYLYTAGCCRKDGNGGSFSFGFIGENQRNSNVNLMDVVELGKAIKENYMLPLKEPIKFFVDDCNYKDKSGLNKLKSMVKYRTQ